MGLPQEEDMVTRIAKSDLAVAMHIEFPFNPLTFITASSHVMLRWQWRR